MKIVQKLTCTLVWLLASGGSSVPLIDHEDGRVFEAIRAGHWHRLPLSSDRSIMLININQNYERQGDSVDFLNYDMRVSKARLGKFSAEQRQFLYSIQALARDSEKRYLHSGVVFSRELPIPGRGFAEKPYSGTQWCVVYKMSGSRKIVEALVIGSH